MLLEISYCFLVTYIIKCLTIRFNDLLELLCEIPQPLQEVRIQLQDQTKPDHLAETHELASS